MKAEIALDDQAYTDELLFPRLAPDMIVRSLSYGQKLDFDAPTRIYQSGTRHWDFFIVLQGEAAVSVPSLSKDEEVIYRHRAGEFSGNTYLLTDRAMLVGMSVRPGTKLLRICHDQFRSFLTSEPDIADTILPAFMFRCMNLVSRSQGGAVVVGTSGSTDTLRIRRFLTGNRYPHRFMDPENEPEAEGILAAMSLTKTDFPVVVSGPLMLRNPGNALLAEKLGLFEPVEADPLYDVAVIGAGPAGLAASVYAASEGLKTIVIEGQAPGGQAGTSSRIENYLGFPAGISGAELASLAQAQAHKFGAKLVVSQNVSSVDCGKRPFAIHLTGGSCVQAKSVIVATGASYRRLDVPNYEQFEMDGIHYSATLIEAQGCNNEEVIVVGGGNSAGQAAMFISQSASHVHMVIRSSDLSATMSAYLSSRINSSRRITIYRNSEIVALDGESKLRGATWRCLPTGVETTVNARNIFVMIGADPRTDLLISDVLLDSKGFVLTGPSAGNEMPYATSVPGIFAVGDVRSGSVKRVASAVGEGSVVVAMVHSYLSKLELDISSSRSMSRSG